VQEPWQLKGMPLNGLVEKVHARQHCDNIKKLVAEFGHLCPPHEIAELYRGVVTSMEASSTVKQFIIFFATKKVQEILRDKNALNRSP